MHEESQTRLYLPPAAEDSKRALDNQQLGTQRPQVGGAEAAQNLAVDAPTIREALRRGLSRPATESTLRRVLQDQPLLGAMHQEVVLEPRLRANQQGRWYRTGAVCAGYTVW